VAATLPKLYLVRHGETEWSISGQHTGLTDKPLLPIGVERAKLLRERLAGIEFGKVFTSPLVRASHTCELAGFADRAVVDRDLVEWDYGDYEGRTTADIRRTRPDWKIFRDGCPGGESVDDVIRRVERFLAHVRQLPGNTLVFSSGHCITALALRWLELPFTAGRNLMVGNASVSILTTNDDGTDGKVALWNDMGHIKPQ
jgi:broad specificity phosphatase PhoE